MMNIKTSNFLTKQELETINRIISYEFNSRKIITSKINGQNLEYEHDKYSISSSDMGRISMRSINLGKTIEKKFLNYAKEITGLLDLKIISIMFTEYNKKYGTPCLMPHYDLGDPNVLLDFQIYSNVNWSVIVDDLEFESEDNSVLNIYNTSQIHYRPAKYFNDGEKIGLLFFNLQSDSFIAKEKDNVLAEIKRKEWKKCQKEVNLKG